MTLIRHHDIDIYHRSTKQAPGTLRGVLLANENEHGHAKALPSRAWSLVGHRTFTSTQSCLGTSPSIKR